jgi:hypothetical protein
LHDGQLSALQYTGRLAACAAIGRNGPAVAELAAHDQVMRLGARVLRPAQGATSGDDFQVYADPAGHPYCLCFLGDDRDMDGRHDVLRLGPRRNESG